MPSALCPLPHLSPAEELRAGRELLLVSLKQREAPDTFLPQYTETVDHYFRRALQESPSGQGLFQGRRRFAVVALGGYGRKELCVHSDLDVMILFEPRIPARARQLASELFFPLWNLALDLGYAVRTVKDCLTLAREDFETLTALIDARFVAGDSPLFLELAESLHRKLLLRKTEALARWLEDQSRLRMERFGDASYLLEPQLKEGIGGLRDYHHMLWLASALFRLRTPRDLEYLGILSHDEYRDLRQHLRFIWQARNLLHLISGRKNDRLAFDHQLRMAEILNFRDRKDFLAVEQFMGRLHSSMAAVKSLHHSFVAVQVARRRKKAAEPRPLGRGLHAAGGEIHFDSAVDLLHEPGLLLGAFVHHASSGMPLSLEARRLVREFLFLVSDEYRRRKDTARDFMSILAAPSAFEALDQMYETGMLEALFPEFTHIRDRVQFDAYHLFPVGRHSLQTLRRMKRLREEQDIMLVTIFSDLSDPEPLWLACLFHDLGKTGKGHARRGVAITRPILKRLGYARAEDVFFLIRQHLLLAETATRRDLDDEKVIVQCARTVGGIERLKMLYLLTWADARATGPRAWNDWIASLVQELFFKVLHILERGELATADAARRVRETRAQVRRLVQDRKERPALENAFEVMSPRYLLNTPPREVVRHLALLGDLAGRSGGIGAEPFVIHTLEQPAEACVVFTFVGRDRQGLFAEVAGVLALNNINILSAQIYTWRDGTAVDVFRVSSPLDRVDPHRVWEKVRRDLRLTFAGRLPLRERLLRKARPSLLSAARPRSRPPRVAVDNASSDFFTLIEVFAHDSVGLLHRITDTLFQLGLDIRIAKIATRGDQVADVFYVRDGEGQKIIARETMAEIKAELLKAIQ